MEKEIDEVIHNYKLNNHRHTSICSADICSGKTILILALRLP